MTDDELKRLFPVIASRTQFANGAWPGPHLNLRHPALALTWAVLNPNRTLTYLSKPETKFLLAKGISWHEISLDNLRRTTGAYPGTTATCGEGGFAQYFVMQHEDGLGSSRLLLIEEIGNYFENGFLLAAPERSVGLAVAKNAPPKIMSVVKNLAAKCNRIGAVPMLPELFQPEDLAFEIF